MTTTGATPLFALEALATDLETTGLDAAKAQIVQIGAVPITAGALLPDKSYERLVDPGAPIPPRSTAVHGITDAMVRGAPRLTDLWPEFTGLIGNRIVIGHTIGFDLTVLAAEARRRQLPWRKPRTLCVRILATVAAPSLASHSLDALADWFGIETHDRHRALGDARAAGQIFLALVPKLEAKGIRTLAEAERACRALDAEMERHVGAGWEQPVSVPGEEVLGRIDTYAYRHRVGDVMASPPVVVPPATTLKAAVDVMVARSISSVFVAEDGSAGHDLSAYAIVTERDAMRRIAARGADALEEAVGALASRPVHAVREHAFLYRAVGRLARLGTRHLGVRSDRNELVGVVSARDMLKLRAGPAIALDDAIEQAGTAKALAVAWSTLPTVVNALVAEAVDADVICQIVSEEIRSMVRRATVLAEQAMHAAGLGEPPCPYCAMVLGSAGRGESLLVPDQDTAIVFEAGEPDGPEDQWFAALGAYMADILDQAGIPYCKGGVMARNADWRGSLDTWRSRVERWVRLSRPQDLLNVDIFFDAAPVHGARALGDTLLDHALARGRQSASFVKLLGQRVAPKGSPVSFFGNLKSRDGRFDLKMHVLFPVVAAARTLAVGHGIAARATRGRIEGLIARQIGGEADLAGLLDAHALGLSLLLAQQSRDIAEGLKPSTLVDLTALTRRQKADLKSALGRLQNLSFLLEDLMFGRPGAPAAS